MIDKNDIDSDKIIMFMIKKCNNKKIYYVHNLTFEIFVFLQYFIKYKIKFKITSSNKNVYSAEIIYGKKKIRLRCSYKLTLLSLKNFALLSNIEEKSIFPYKILNNNFCDIVKIDELMFNNIKEYNIFKNKYGEIINTYKIIEEYCKNDAYITKKAINNFWDIIISNGLKNNNKILTAAKLSIENYFLNNKIVKKKINIKYDRLIRTGYYGGRTEVFGNPNDGDIILHYDWSGMYAQCMQEKVLGGEIIESQNIIGLENPGFYYIVFEQDLEYPILPTRYKEKLMFLNGTIEGWYWFEEILLAIEFGIKIKKIKKRISCEYYEYFLKDFININNEIRKISPLHKQIGKNNNNTFYGRLGMNPNRLEEEILSNITNIKEYVKIDKINDIYIGYKKTEKKVSNVLISASITAKARIKLYKGIIEIIKNNGKILYTDTDSVIASFKKENYLNVLDRKIGEIYFDSKDKNTIIKDAVFAMPKTYALKYHDNREIIKMKGFNVLPNFDYFKETFYEKKSIITENNFWNKKDFLISNDKIVKSTNLFSLNKRKWDEQLKNTIPLYI
jgi:hypothetical protein